MVVAQSEERNMYDQHWLCAVLKEIYPYTIEYWHIFLLIFGIVGSRHIILLRNLTLLHHITCLCQKMEFFPFLFKLVFIDYKISF